MMNVRSTIRLLWSMLAIRAIAGFFHRDQDQLITRRGHEVLATPHLKTQVDAAVEAHRSAGKHGQVVVTFRPIGANGPT